MSTVTKKRIQVASFSTSDIDRYHLVAMALGAVLLAGSAVLAVASNGNARAAADSRGASRLLALTAAQVLTGTQSFMGGGSGHLGTATATAPQVNSAFADVLSSANTVLVLPSLKDPAGNAYTAWNGLSGSLNALAVPVSLASELSVSAGRLTGNFAAVVKKLESKQGQYPRAYDSAARLYTYAEAGIGMASVGRVDYDLKVLQADLGSSEFKGDIAFTEPLAAAARVAATKMVTKEQLAAALESAGAAKSAADQLSAASSQAQGSLVLGAGALFLALAGLLCTGLGLHAAASEFSKRYARALQQFRGNEQARQDLIDGLRGASAGAIHSDIVVPASASDVADIARLVNDVLARVRDGVAAATDAISAGVASGSQVMSSTEAVIGDGNRVATDLERAAEDLAERAQSCHATAMDSVALANAAAEAASRSADATRIAQDAASRLDAMREGLQDTSKRIKRLGERSQEINGVVDSMEVLSEQIGVLALNASLEAERAGDAGAGFRLVAREVDALARRSEEALLTISKLVQGVQSDARSAAESVEKSTAQVVAGANVGSLSHALLGVLAPLAESITTMAKAVENGAKSNAESMGASSRAAATARSSVRSVLEKVGALRTPVDGGRRHLERGLAALTGLNAHEVV